MYINMCVISPSHTHTHAYTYTHSLFLSLALSLAHSLTHTNIYLRMSAHAMWACYVWKTCFSVGKKKEIHVLSVISLCSWVAIFEIVWRIAFTTLFPLWTSEWSCVTIVSLVLKDALTGFPIQIVALRSQHYFRCENVNGAYKTWMELTIWTGNQNE